MLEALTAPTTAVRVRKVPLNRAGPIVVLLLLGMGVVLAACGDTSGDPGSGQSAQGSPSQRSSQSGAVAFAQCMRSHGVTDFPDPDQNGRFLLTGSIQNNPNLQSATKACQNLLPNGTTNGGGNNSQLLAFSRCMQTHGVPNFPDPAANGSMVGGSGIDPNSPQFKQAYQECQSLLPGGAQAQQP